MDVWEGKYRKLFRLSTNQIPCRDEDSEAYRRGFRERFDSKTVGSVSASIVALRPTSLHSIHNTKKRRSSDSPIDLVKEEERLKKESSRFSLRRIFQNAAAAIIVFFLYLALWDTLLVSLFTAALTIYHFYEVPPLPTMTKIDFVFLSVALVIPINTAIGFAFNRRERALDHISRIRSCSFQIYLSHALWDWGTAAKPGRASQEVDWVKHTDMVLEQLIGLGDEISRFLTLPTSSLPRHRMLKSGRVEAARIIKVSYRLFNNLYTKRISKLSQLTEKLKLLGLSSTECSRIRQYERFIGESLEALRIIKAYRTPIVLRVFGRLFTLVLPPLYAPTFASYGHLWLAIVFSMLSPVIVMGLYEALVHLEDPFVGFVILDGINAREEFEVLQWHQLTTARGTIFPDAPPFSYMPDSVGTKESTNHDEGELNETNDVVDPEDVMTSQDLTMCPTSNRKEDNTSVSDSQLSMDRNRRQRNRKDDVDILSKNVAFNRRSIHLSALQLDDLDV